MLTRSRPNPARHSSRANIHDCEYDVGLEAMKAEVFGASRYVFFRALTLYSLLTWHCDRNHAQESAIRDSTQSYDSDHSSLSVTSPRRPVSSLSQLSDYTCFSPCQKPFYRDDPVLLTSVLVFQTFRCRCRCLKTPSWLKRSKLTLSQSVCRSEDLS